MQSKNKYIGDVAFEKMLTHYKCLVPISVIKMRFAGAICSPNLDIRPSDVISSFWEEGKAPRLETKEEADLFFKFFMGLWDEVFELVQLNKIKLSPQKIGPHACLLRFEEIELGFIEGFWAGEADIKIPVFVAEMLTNLTNLANIYATLAKNENLKALNKSFEETDKMVEKAIEFIIENYVHKRIEDLKRSMN